MTDNIVSFAPSSIVYKDQIVNKLALEKQYCKKNFQTTLWFFYHHDLGQMQFIDTNAQFRTMRELYKMQGFEYAGTTDALGITASMIGARSLKRHTYRNNSMSADNMEKGLPIDPLSTLCGYQTAFNEFVIYEVNW